MNDQRVVRTQPKMAEEYANTDPPERRICVEE